MKRNHSIIRYLQRTFLAQQNNFVSADSKTCNVQGLLENVGKEVDTTGIELGRALGQIATNWFHYQKSITFRCIESHGQMICRRNELSRVTKCGKLVIQ